jgi:hypothetical protein
MQVTEDLARWREIGEAYAQQWLSRLMMMMMKQRSQRSVIGCDQNLLSRAPPCFVRLVKPLVPAAFAVVSTQSSFK